MNNELRKQENSHLKINLAILLICILFGLLTVILAFAFSQLKLWQFLTASAILAILYFAFRLYTIALFKRFSYYMDERGLFINKGVFWRRKIVVPINRVQHTDISQGPIARKFDLAELTVFTAGTASASVKIDGILHSDASELRESLSFKESDDAV